MMRPSFIGNYADFLDEDNSHYPGDEELFSIGAAVGKKLGLQKIGIHIEILPPGRRTSYPHAESLEEEFAFVIEGHPHVWIDGEIYPLSPGDFVAFPSGTGICHTFLNNSKHVAKLLVGGEAKKSENKIIYPLNDSRNLVMRTQERLWENAPVKLKGNHDGRPDKLIWKSPDLHTDRLLLRGVKLSDAPAIFAYSSLPEVPKYASWEPHKTVKDSEDFIRMVQRNSLHGTISYSICFKENPDHVIGDVSAFWSSKPHKIMELGAVIHPDHWGKGIVAEALKALIDHCWKTQDVNRIQARCFKENEKSFKMMQKFGMKYEGTIYGSFFAKGKSQDMEMFSIVRK